MQHLHSLNKLETRQTKLERVDDICPPRQCAVDGGIESHHNHERRASIILRGPVALEIELLVHGIPGRHSPQIASIDVVLAHELDTLGHEVALLAVQLASSGIQKADLSHCKFKNPSHEKISTIYIHIHEIQRLSHLVETNIVQRLHEDHDFRGAAVHLHEVHVSNGFR